MSFDAPRPRPTKLPPCDTPENPRALAWTILEREVLQAFNRRLGGISSRKLKVVHPKDTVYQAALEALRADDWDDEAMPRPYAIQFEYRSHEFWVMEEFRGLGN